MTVTLYCIASFLAGASEDIVGKYLLGWLLGVPAIVLIAIYLFMH
ncbi:hypothetical protein QN362_02270 [Actimicrobium sp. CCC2.4]|nr:hypothetical protein [Actimicrobium sp. CCC2.4]MEB0134149.1 hypothetical protein [Actimicrobium sp. CCC2.4]WPX32804.1 hypothetical protein RHM62_02830 [Actimicrobium sp. CCC2.4]